MQAALRLIPVLLALSCARAPSAASKASAASEVGAPSRGDLTANAQHDLVFTGMCDASAAVPLDAHSFVVADDEDNVLRAYDVQRPGPPLWSVDVSAAIGLSSRGHKGPPEIDIEAATRVGSLAFWLTSHGRNSKAKLKPERLKLFATTLPVAGEPITVAGRAYENLLDDLLAEPRLARFGLEQAATFAPKAPGGLSLEGMTARPEGGVWIGFRNPIPNGAALLVPLLNPERVIHGERAQLGEPRLLDLAGLGVRAISERDGRYLVLAGHYDARPGARLYTWDGALAVTERAQGVLDGLSPEGFFSPDSGKILVLSDDGSVSIDGVECKRLKDTTKKRYRARWIDP